MKQPGSTSLQHFGLRRALLGNAEKCSDSISTPLSPEYYNIYINFIASFFCQLQPGGNMDVQEQFITIFTRILTLPRLIILLATA